MSLRAVMAIIGRLCTHGASSVRIFFNKSKPFMAGICISVRSTSKCSSFSLSNSVSGWWKQLAVTPGQSNMAAVSCSCMRSSSIRARRTGTLLPCGSSPVQDEFSSGREGPSGKGRYTWKQLPLPGSLSILMSPSSKSTNLRVIASPRPNPSCPCALWRRVNS